MADEDYLPNTPTPEDFDPVDPETWESDDTYPTNADARASELYSQFGDRA